MSGTLTVANTQIEGSGAQPRALGPLRLSHCLSLVCNRVWWPEATYLINRDRRLIYCPIAKVACSSITRWFLNVAGVPSEQIIPDEHLCAGKTLSLRAVGPRESLAALRDPSFYSFAFVRNPWARLVSAYLNKFLRGISISEKVLREISRGSHESAAEGISFRQFVDYLAKGSPDRFDVHWRPQHLFLRDYRFRFLGRFENLRRDFEQLREQLRIEIPLPHLNTTSYDKRAPKCHEMVADWPTRQLRELPALPAWQRFYTSDLRDLVARIYARDAQLFGYRFEDE